MKKYLLIFLFLSSCSGTIENTFINNVIGSYQDLISSPNIVLVDSSGNISIDSNMVYSLYYIRNGYSAIYLIVDSVYGIGYIPIIVSNSILYRGDPVLNLRDVSFKNLNMFAIKIN